MSMMCPTWWSIALRTAVPAQVQVNKENSNTDNPLEPIEYDYSEVDEENARDLRKRGNK